MKKLLIPVIITIIFILAAASVSAQDVNINEMSNAELSTLLMQIMQKLEESEEESAAPKPTPLPTPTATPQPELTDDKAELEALLTAIMQKLQQDQGNTEEAAVNSIWENKKLLIEALPEYMFIRPTEEPKPERRTNGSKSSGGDLESYCTGKCMGYSDFSGTEMLDMGCYARCIGDI